MSMLRSFVSKLLTFSVLSGTATQVQAQAPVWQTVAPIGDNSQGSNSSAVVIGSAADAAGNVYVAGVLNGTVVLAGTTLTSAGGEDAFLAKWSATSRSFVWAQRAGGPGNDRGFGVALSGGSVYLVGSFQGTMSLGGLTLTSAGDYDGYVAKLTDAGTTAGFVWAQRTGGAGADAVQAVAATGSSVYLAGSFAGTATFGSFALTSAGQADVAVAKLTDTGATGSFVWAQQAGGTNQETANALALGDNGAVYVAGGFQGTAAFGSTTLTAASNGYNDAFVAKLTDAGSTVSFTWAQRAGGSDGDDFVLGLAATGNSVYAVGLFSVKATFGPLLVTGAGGADAFLTKLTDAGSSSSFTWTQRIGGSGYDSALAVAVAGSSVYVTGLFSNVADAGSASLSSAGFYDVFLARCTDAGASSTFTWAQRAGGTGADQGLALAISGIQVCVSGSFTAAATFGSLSISTPTMGNTGFLATLTDTTPMPTAAASEPLDLSLYPNPAHAAVSLLPAVLGAVPVHLTLYDAPGRVVRTASLLPGQAQRLDLTGLPAGSYVLRVQAGAAWAVRHLLVD